jgi:hypothetical protein
MNVNLGCSAIGWVMCVLLGGPSRQRTRKTPADNLYWNEDARRRTGIHEIRKAYWCKDYGLPSRSSTSYRGGGRMAKLRFSTQ